jgi:hypothetical protein
MNFFFGYSLLKPHVENKSGFQRNQHPFLTHIGDNSGMAGCGWRIPNHAAIGVRVGPFRRDIHEWLLSFCVQRPVNTANFIGLHPLHSPRVLA